MANEIKSKLQEEALREFMYRVKYRVNETPKYRPLVEMGEEFDELPEANDAGEQQTPPPQPNNGEVPPVDPNLQATDSGEPIPPATPATPVPEFDQAGGNASADSAISAGNPSVPPPVEPTVPEIDDVQNEIIKHNIEAMKAIHDQLEGLNNLTQSLNGKLDMLSAEVEEVREPTNVEKLLNKTSVSHPYYYNLNDFWGKDNWFNQQREKEGSKGIKEMPDGTYMADFDDLPQKSKTDLQNSFNEIDESVGKKRIIKEWGTGTVPMADKSAIDGRSKQSAKNVIYNKITPLTQGFFRDDAWQNVKKIFEAFGQLGFDWDILGAKYVGNPPSSKKWEFEILFTDNNGKPQKFWGQITAAAAGTDDDPFTPYDLTVIIS
jgi:hypothetical protein